jgi:hypothetical protein
MECHTLVKDTRVTTLVVWTIKGLTIDDTYQEEIVVKV